MRITNTVPLVLVLAFASAGFCQQQQLDSTYEPPTDMPGYSATFAARVAPQNARGYKGPYVIPARGSVKRFTAPSTANPKKNSASGKSQRARNAVTATTSALPGSRSYNYAIPLLALPGRNGLNVNLTLYYNSNVWTINKAYGVGTATFNADRDFPGYGFRLGYGYLEHDNLSDTYVQTESDGSKRQFTSIGNATYTSTDGLKLYYDSTSHEATLTYKNGLNVSYQRFAVWDATNNQVTYKSTLLRPYQLQDATGQTAFRSLTSIRRLSLGLKARKYRPSLTPSVESLHLGMTSSAQEVAKFMH